MTRGVKIKKLSTFDQGMSRKPFGCCVIRLIKIKSNLSKSLSGPQSLRFYLDLFGSLWATVKKSSTMISSYQFIPSQLSMSVSDKKKKRRKGNSNTTAEKVLTNAFPCRFAMPDFFIFSFFLALWVMTHEGVHGK